MEIEAKENFHFNEGVMAANTVPSQYALFPATSSICQLVATADSLIIDNVDNAATLGIGAVTQGQANVPLIRMKLKTSAKSVIWSGLRVDRRNTVGLNSDSDVDAVKVYQDCGVAQLAQSMTTATTGTVYLTTTNFFGPHGVLYIGNEIMRYDTILSSTSVDVFSRGYINTAPIIHSVGDAVTATGDGLMEPGVDKLVSSPLQNMGVCFFNCCYPDHRHPERPGDNDIADGRYGRR